MKSRRLITMALVGIALGFCTDCKAGTTDDTVRSETAKAVKCLEENSLLSPESDKAFYKAFGRYRSGKTAITNFPFLAYLCAKSREDKPIPAEVIKAFIECECCG